jgi:hypothetical protein
MSDETKKTEKRTEELELNRETLQDLTELESEQVKGGMATKSLRPTGCNKSQGCA